MLNQVVIVGRLNKEIEVKELDNTKIGILELKVPRSYKNEKGEYDNDYIKCEIRNSVLENTLEYIKVNDIIGIKGRVESESDTMIIKAEKVTFLSSKKED